MPSADLLVAFALATAIFAYMPGPAMLYTAAQTLARGRRGGLMAALGIHVGCYVHVLGAVLGLAALMRLVPEIYLAIKLAGAAYLVWLGISMIRGARGENPAVAISSRSPARAFVDSMLVEILNPKTAIFFVAFLPQFVDPAAALPVWAQLLVLGTIVNLAFSSADIVVILVASAAMVRLKASTMAQRFARAVGGTILIGLGARMAMDRT
ncbi:LysE family translocator [Microbaculum marinum]|uniref:LysE family translocator n=1 Tax=Microbaculum marinum TaxID=1764581 RepID=A0AAW9S089_9HYPH